MDHTEATFNDWFSAEYGRVLAAVRVVCGSQGQRAEDATNEAFAIAYERWSEVSQMADPVAWTTRVAVNKARRWWQRGKRGQELERFTYQRGAVEPEPSDLELHALLASMPRRQREALILRYIEQLTQLTRNFRQGDSQIIAGG